MTIKGTAAVHSSRSEISIDVVGENGRVLIRASCAFNVTPVRVNPQRQIAAMLERLARVADIEIADIRISLARDNNGRQNGLLGDMQRRTLAQELANKFRVRVAFEDAGSIPDVTPDNLRDFGPCRRSRAALGDLPGIKIAAEQTLEMQLDTHGVWEYTPQSAAKKPAQVNPHRRRKT